MIKKTLATFLVLSAIGCVTNDNTLKQLPQVQLTCGFKSAIMAETYKQATGIETSVKVGKLGDIYHAQAFIKKIDGVEYPLQMNGTYIKPVKDWKYKQFKPILDRTPEQAKKYSLIKIK